MDGEEALSLLSAGLPEDQPLPIAAVSAAMRWPETHGVALGPLEAFLRASPQSFRVLDADGSDGEAMVVKLPEPSPDSTIVVAASATAAAPASPAGVAEPSVLVQRAREEIGRELTAGPPGHPWCPCFPEPPMGSRNRELLSQFHAHVALARAVDTSWHRFEGSLTASDVSSLRDMSTSFGMCAAALRQRNGLYYVYIYKPVPTALLGVLARLYECLQIFVDARDAVVRLEFYETLSDPLRARLRRLTDAMRLNLVFVHGAAHISGSKDLDAAGGRDEFIPPSMPLNVSAEDVARLEAVLQTLPSGPSSVEQADLDAWRRSLHEPPALVSRSCHQSKVDFRVDMAMRERMQGFRSTLPVIAQWQDILCAVKRNRVVIIAGDTGCGKTTQVPQLMLDSGVIDGKILCTQPRRISAISVAERVAQERGGLIGHEVGYQIRFESRASSRTRLVYLTPGVLLRKLQSDATLSGVGAVVVDEAHERDLNTDFSLVVLRRLLQTTRQDMRLVVMSATMNEELFSRYFASVGGRPAPPPVPSDEAREPDSVSSGDDGEGKQASEGGIEAEKVKVVAENNNIPDDGAEIPVGPAPLVRVQGMMYPVQEYYLEDALEVTGLSVESVDDWSTRRGGRRAEAAAAAAAALATSSAVSRMPAVRKILGDFCLSQGRSPYSEKVLQGVCYAMQTATVHSELLVALVHHFHEALGPGAILVFLPGWAEITRIMTALSPPGAEEFCSFDVHSLHSQVALEQQRKVFAPAPPGRRKVVLATNVAETSVTINDVICVLDSGVLKVDPSLLLWAGTLRSQEKMFDPRSGLQSLELQLVSQASAIQRRGRAGRCQPGVCVHLFSRATFSDLSECQSAEMVRTPLEDLCLTICLLRLGTPHGFLSEAPDPPTPGAIDRAVDLLTCVGAFDDSQEPTPLGRLLSELPVHPQVGKMLVVGACLGVLEPVTVVAAALSHRGPFVFVPERRREEVDRARERLAAGATSDHLLALRAFRGWEKAPRGGGAQRQYCSKYGLSESALKTMERTKDQFLQVLTDSGLVPSDKKQRAALSRHEDDHRLVLCAIAAGLYPNVLCVRRGREGGWPRVFSAEGTPHRIHPQSVNCTMSLRAEWLVYYERLRTSNLHVMDCSAVQPLPLLLFSRSLSQGSASDRRDALLVVDGWMLFSAKTRPAGLLLRLRGVVQWQVCRAALARNLDHFDEGLVDVIRRLLRAAEDIEEARRESYLLSKPSKRRRFSS